MRTDGPLDLLASLVLEDGRRWGDAAAGFQWQDARAVLDADGAPYHFLTRARGASKTSDLAALALAAMLAQLPPRSRLYGIAGDREQGRLLVDSISGYVERTPALRRSVQLDNFKVTATRGGSTLDVLAADAPGAWGLRPAFAIVDEISAWPGTLGARRLFEAVTTAAAKVPGSRMVLLGTAGDPAHWSHKVLQHAQSDALWRVHEVPGPPPWIDPARLEEQRRRLLDSSFRRLFMNEWTGADDRLVRDDDLAACVVLAGPLPPQPGLRYTIGVDVGLKRDRTVCDVAHGEPVRRVVDSLGGEVTTGVRVVVDRIAVWQGSRDRAVPLAEVEEWLAQAANAYQGARVVLDPWQAVGMMQRLQARGVVCEEFTFSATSVGRIAATLHGLLRDRLLALPDDEALLDELRNVRLEERTPGVVRLAHDADRHDDRAVALALAAHSIVGQPSAPTSSPLFGRLAEPDFSDVRVTDFDGERTQGGRRDDHLWGRERDEQWWAQFEATL